MDPIDQCNLDSAVKTKPTKIFSNQKKKQKLSNLKSIEKTSTRIKKVKLGPVALSRCLPDMLKSTSVKKLAKHQMCVSKQAASPKTSQVSNSRNSPCFKHLNTVNPTMQVPKQFSSIRPIRVTQKPVSKTTCLSKRRAEHLTQDNAATNKEYIRNARVTQASGPRIINVLNTQATYANCVRYTPRPLSSVRTILVPKVTCSAVRNPVPGVKLPNLSGPKILSIVRIPKVIKLERFGQAMPNIRGVPMMGKPIVVRPLAPRIVSTNRFPTVVHQKDDPNIISKEKKIKRLVPNILRKKPRPMNKEKTLISH